ncbi:MAG: SRPBCC domain-containing protein [Candidatus Aenigmarchaeota archaeon]|nr:SRPBCC domain-containing protein [Candidatus Aenigmarchaeota archaeon]
MKTKAIKQTVTFKTSPGKVYQALMNSKLHSKFTGSKAKMSNKVGGKFSAYDGYIEGVNLELVKYKKIVQKWRGGDWPRDHYSVVTFSLKQIKSGTKLTFTQIGVPQEHAKAISDGWHEHYWEPMKKMLETKKLC